jgi:hypothetical protein
MKTIAIAASLLFAGCTATANVGVGERVEIPKDSATKCSSLCGSISLTLDSVVVMASTVGCVCRAAPAASASSAASGGMAAIMLQQEERQQQEQQDRQRRQQQRK